MLVRAQASTRSTQSIEPPVLSAALVKGKLRQERYSFPLSVRGAAARDHLLKSRGLRNVKQALRNQREALGLHLRHVKTLKGVLIGSPAVVCKASEAEVRALMERVRAIVLFMCCIYEARMTEQAKRVTFVVQLIAAG